MSSDMAFKKKSKPEQETTPDEVEGVVENAEAEQELDPIEALRAERDDFESKYLRALADFQNFQRRAAQNERVALESGTASVVKSMLRVLEQFDLALSVDSEKTDVASLLAGVRMIRGELFRALTEHGTVAIEPVAGEDMHPEHHEAVGYMPSEEHPEGAVAHPVSTGYRIGERVLMPARVMLAAPVKVEGEETDEGNEPESKETNDADI
ncbi:MAG: nucleotide exchange factor GrpE [Phycisphaerales bacterium JB043]